VNRAPVLSRRSAAAQPARRKGFAVAVLPWLRPIGITERTDCRVAGDMHYRVGAISVQGGIARVKITDIRTTVITGNVEWVLVHVETDAGITGYGEAVFDGRRRLAGDGVPCR
jgi:hypothetical protein